MVNDHMKNIPDPSQLLQSTLNTYVPNTSNSSSSLIQFNSPLIIIEGNADANTVKSLEHINDKLINEIISRIETKQSRTKRLRGESSLEQKD